MDNVYTILKNGELQFQGDTESTLAYMRAAIFVADKGPCKRCGCSARYHNLRKNRKGEITGFLQDIAAQVLSRNPALLGRHPLVCCNDEGSLSFGRGCDCTGYTA